MPQQGVILFAHGARDARWAEPFRALAAKVAARRPDIAVTLAFLEHLSPDLAGALDAQARAGVREVRVVPLFFGRGGHLREDFPVLLDAARAQVPQVAVQVAPAAGEDGDIQDALASFALRDLR